MSIKKEATAGNARREILPNLEGRPAMSREQAINILNRDDVKLIPAWVIDECKAVMKGETWWKG